VWLEDKSRSPACASDVNASTGVALGLANARNRSSSAKPSASDSPRSCKTRSGFCAIIASMASALLAASIRM
jgi:hypothetical protein